MCTTAVGLLLALTLGSPAEGQVVNGPVSRQNPIPIEAFLLAGTVYGGAVTEPLRSWLSRQTSPQIGGAVHIPVRRHWAIALDVTTSALEAYWKWDGRRPAGPEDNFARVRRATAVPSVLRVWRARGFSVYGGGGMGVERQREFTRYKRIVARVNGQPVVADSLTEEHVETIFVVPIAVRAGVILNPGRRLALRVGYSYAMRYADLPGTQGLDVGLGYRFARGL